MSGGWYPPGLCLRRSPTSFDVAILEGVVSVELCLVEYRQGYLSSCLTRGIQLQRIRGL